MNTEDCREQSYDNASNMSEIYNGLQGKIQEQAALAMFVPCAAYFKFVANSEKLNIVSAQIQTPSVHVLKISDLYGSLLEFVTAEREYFEYFEERAVDMSSFKQHQGDVKTKRKNLQTKHQMMGLKQSLETLSVLTPLCLSLIGSELNCRQGMMHT
ncbi:hypothetical protein HHI36_010447 [Cryptolaemus montrouzieri]|uniref:Uncharacterized protein n=1 Tax=Cryptolaemus montrouzieri TaxID=559131 RepID=A0ABD2MIY6_9CUCU